MHKGNIVKNFDAVGGADLFDNFVSKGFIASAKNIRAAQNGGLQNWIIVRVTYDGWKDVRNLHKSACRLERDKVLFYRFSRQGPSGLNVRGGPALAEPRPEWLSKVSAHEVPIRWSGEDHGQVLGVKPWGWREQGY